jgi:hypothetical protein
MDRVTTLDEMVRQEIAEYNKARDWKARGYYIQDLHQHLYTIVIVPEQDHPLLHRPDVMMMARVVGDKVVIHEDTTDRPLYEALMRAGISREQIVLAYAGEQLSEE